MNQHEFKFLALLSARIIFAILFILLGVVAFNTSTVFKSDFVAGVYIAPFVITSMLVLFATPKQVIQLSVASLCAFAILMAMYAVLLHDLSQKGGGVNIGLGLLLMAMPLILPTVMFVSGTIAGSFINFNESDSQKENT